MHRIATTLATALGILIVVNLPPQQEAPSPRVTILFQAYVDPNDPLSFYPLMQKTRAAFGKHGFTDACEAQKANLPSLRYVEVRNGVKAWQGEKAIRRMQEFMPDVPHKEVAQYYPDISIGALLLHLDQENGQTSFQPRVELIRDIDTCEEQVDAFLAGLPLVKRPIKERQDPLLPDRRTLAIKDDRDWLALLPSWLVEGIDYRVKLMCLTGLIGLVCYFSWRACGMIKPRRHPTTT